MLNKIDIQKKVLFYLPRMIIICHFIEEAIVACILIMVHLCVGYLSIKRRLQAESKLQILRLQVILNFGRKP